MENQDRFTAWKCPEKLKEDTIVVLILMHKTYPSLTLAHIQKYKLLHLSSYTESNSKGISGAEIPTVHVDFSTTGLSLGTTSLAEAIGYLRL